MVDELYRGVACNRYDREPLERAFAEQWQEVNQVVIGGDNDLLAYLLSTTNERVPVTREASKIAATVIQWLGSNPGQSFLRDVQERHKMTKKAIAWDDELDDDSNVVWVGTAPSKSIFWILKQRLRDNHIEWYAMDSTGESWVQIVDAKSACQKSLDKITAAANNLVRGVTP